MKLEDIKNPMDILQFMKDNIKYGWLDIYNEEHIENMKDFRKLYRTSSAEETLSHKMGTCIEQVYLMKIILDKLNIPSKMFCTRIYEDANHTDMEADEHMHCFVLYYQDDLVYQIEHPNWKRIGIYEFKDEKTAINEINKNYLDETTKKERPVTEFYEVIPNMSFKEFNSYINSLDMVSSKQK